VEYLNPAVLEEAATRETDAPTVDLLEFAAPETPESAQPTEAPKPPEPLELTELPEVPEMPEIPPMPALLPLETPSPSRQLPMPNKPMEPAKVNKPETKPIAASPGGTGITPAKPTVFTGGGGSFPQPTYPASARASRQQGSVRLLVTVEANGSPSTIVVSSSSGHAVLDRAARDVVSRRWKWPAGPIRQYIIPFNFVLK
jgi:protein TonB